jgi:putative tryptophan/tyrosine transport system substrate-binding protein
VRQRGRRWLTTMPVIGFLSSASPAGYANLVAAFRDGVQETGLEVGRNVTIEFEWAKGELDRLPRLAADLVRRQVAVNASTGAPATIAAKAATSTIPIAFMTGDDPVKFDLVASLGRPGGNVTGVSFLTAAGARIAGAFAHRMTLTSGPTITVHVGCDQ